jgi:hypothetical protein
VTPGDSLAVSVVRIANSDMTDDEAMLLRVTGLTDVEIVSTALTCTLTREEASAFIAGFTIACDYLSSKLGAEAAL